MENQPTLVPPHFIVGPRSLKDRIFSFCNPIQFLKLSKNRGDFLEACQNHDLDKITRLWPKIGGLNWSASARQIIGRSTPLDVCIRYKHPDLVELLLKEGANPNFKENLLFPRKPCSFETFGEIGSRMNSIDLESLSLLLNYGVREQINQIWNPLRSNDKFKGNNLLHVALKKRVPDAAIELLLQNGANPYIENIDSDNAFSLLKGERRDSTLNLLKIYAEQSNFQKNIPKIQEEAINGSEPSRVQRL